MKTIKLLAVAALALSACGDNKEVPDARVKDGTVDTPEVIPAVPTIGAQIDRMGRPTVNTALNHGFDETSATVTDKKAYNEKSTLAEWTAAPLVGEFMSNLAIIDVLDTGVCGNGICEAGETTVNCPTSAGGDCTVAGTTANGCGNQAMYNGTGMGAPAATSYQPLAGLLAVDHLYLDSTKSSCAFYLAVEFGVVTGGGNSTCGGRAPQYDVIDFSYSMLAMGLKGFNAQLQPLVKDDVPAHTDYLSDFPYLGAPH